MKYENIMIYLERVRVFCFQDGADLLRIPFEGNWSMEHLAQALSEACDIIYDYEKATEQAARMAEKYETSKKAIMRGSGNLASWQCPDCQKFISHGNEHCHWCGRKIGWSFTGGRKRK